MVDDSDDELCGPILTGDLLKDKNALSNFMLDSDDEEEFTNKFVLTENGIFSLCYLFLLRNLT